MPAAWWASRAYLEGARPETTRLKAVASSLQRVTEGIGFAERRQWLEAVESLEHAAESGQAGAGVYRGLGFCLGQLGWIEDAASAYEESIRLEPAALDTYVSLATTYRVVGRRELALGILERAEVRLRAAIPRDAAARFARAAAPSLEALSEAYAHLGEFVKAIYWSRQAELADPTRASAYMLEGKSCLAIHQPDTAIAPLRRACALAPGAADAHYTLALAFLERPSPDHNQEAYNSLVTAVALDPKAAPALHQLGILCAQRRQWPQAQRALMAAYQLDFAPIDIAWRAAKICQATGDEAQAHYLFGQHAEKKGDLETALRHFQSLCESSRYRRFGYSGTARVLSALGKPQEAIDSLRQGIALDEHPAPLYRQLASLYGKLRRVNEQVAALETATRLDPAQADADYRNLGVFSFESGQYDQAERYLEKAVEMRPDNSRYHYALGQTYLMRAQIGDRLSRAIFHLEAAGRLAPGSGFAHDLLSAAYVKAGRWGDAVRDLRTAINNDSQNEVLYFRLAQAYQRLGRKSEAGRAVEYYRRIRAYAQKKDLLRRRAKARPDDAAAHKALGGLLLSARDYHAAYAEFERVLSLTPDDVQAHESMATIYGELAQPEGQARHLARTRELRRKAGAR
jgi:tetratricopeptide (TPR) repeat protein